MVDALYATLADLTHFHLPSIPSKLPYECHPNVFFHAEKADDWYCRSMQIFSDEERLKVTEGKFPWFTSMTLPRGVDDRKMILSGVCMTLFFQLDDILESSSLKYAKSFIHNVLRAAEEGDALSPLTTSAPCPDGDESASRSFHMCIELLSQFRELMSSQLYSRHLGCLKRFFDGCFEEVTNNQKDRIPSPEEYRLLHCESSWGEGVSAILGEFVMGLELKQQDRESAVYRDLIQRVVDHCILVNDLFSFRKEFYKRSCHNWLVVLVNSRRRKMMNVTTAIQEAVDQVCEMIRDTEDEILDLQRQLIDQAVVSEHEDLLKFAYAYPLVAAGNLRWSFCTSRYHGLNNPVVNNEPFHGTLVMDPDKTIILPKPLLRVAKAAMYRNWNNRSFKFNAPTAAALSLKRSLPLHVSSLRLQG